MSDQDEKPKTEIGEYAGGGYYAMKDLLVIMKRRSKKLRYYLGSEIAGIYRPPFDIPTFLQRAEEAGETITDKQRRKLIKRYGREWNYYLEHCTKPAEAPEFVSYYRRN